MAAVLMKGKNAEPRGSDYTDVNMVLTLILSCHSLNLPKVHKFLKTNPSQNASYLFYRNTEVTLKITYVL